MRLIVKAGIDPHLADVHTMLRLPLPVLGLGAGCGFAIVNVLTACVSGVSVLMYRSQGGSGELFRQFLCDFYPWQAEPDRPGVAVGVQAAEELYDEYRNPFAHALGISVRSRGTERTLVRRDYQVKVKRRTEKQPDETNGGLSEDAIAELEGEGPRPSWLSATLIIQPHKRVLSVEALYWGVRQSILAVCRDPARMAAAAEFLQDAHIKPREPGTGRIAR